MEILNSESGFTNSSLEKGTDDIVEILSNALSKRLQDPKTLGVREQS